MRARAWWLAALVCGGLAGVALGQDGTDPVKFDRRWIERWKEEARKYGVDLTDEEIRKFVDDQTGSGVARISRDYALEMAADEPRARAKAMSALTSIAVSPGDESEAITALRLLERFAAQVADEHAGAPARFAEIAGQVPVGPRRTAALGGQVRALCRLERFDEATAVLAAARAAYGDQAAALTGLEGEVRVLAIRAQLVVGRTPPALAGTTLTGERWSSATARGTVVVVYFWSRTDRASVVRLPELAALARAHAGDALRVVGVAIDEDREKLTSFCRDWTLPFPQLCDGTGWQDPAVRAWAIGRVPRCWVLDRRGVVRHVDPKGAEALSKAVAALLAEPADAK